MLFVGLQIDDFKLMKDHQTGRSAGFGFITVSNVRTWLNSFIYANSVIENLLFKNTGLTCAYLVHFCMRKTFFI